MTTKSYKRKMAKNSRLNDWIQITKLNLYKKMREKNIKREMVFPFGR